VFKKLRGHGKLTEADIKAAMREVRMALLEADVNYKVAKDFCAKVSERAMGQEVMESLTPAQQVVKIVNEELVALMGGSEAARLNRQREHRCARLFTHHLQLIDGRRAVNIAGHQHGAAALFDKVLCQLCGVGGFRWGGCSCRSWWTSRKPFLWTRPCWWWTPWPVRMP